MLIVKEVVNKFRHFSIRLRRSKSHFAVSPFDYKKPEIVGNRGLLRPLSRGPGF